MLKITIASVPSVKEYTSKKTGKPFKKIYFKANEYGNDVISGFFRAEMSSWKKGDTVEVEDVSGGTVSQDGKSTFRDFKMPDKNAAAKETDKKLEQVLNYLVGIKIDIAIIKDHVVPKKGEYGGVKYPTAEDEGIDLDADNFGEPSMEELNETLND